MVNINPLFNSENSFKISADVNKLNNISKKRLIQDKKLKETAKAFESIMMKQMFKSMKKNVLKSNLFKENQAIKIFDDFLTTERSQNAVKYFDIGIAKAIYQQNIKYIK